MITKKEDNVSQKHIGIQVDLYMEIGRKDVATLYPRKNLTRIGTLRQGWNFIIVFWMVLKEI